jgi:predicted DNA-binding transcriptional regulator AlpA
MHTDQQRYTSKEVAKILGVSTTWLYRRRKEIGTGPDFFNFRRRYFYYESDVERWRESRRNLGQIVA